MSTRVGLYGGSFDPIHHGHLIVARSLAERLELDRVVLLPSARPPHKDGRTLAPPQDRADMVRLAIADEPLFEFSDFDLTRPGPTYTVDTVTHFRAVFGGQTELFWIIGADSLGELSTWRRAGDLVESCRVVTAARAGFAPADTLWIQLRRTLSDAQVDKVRAGIVETPIIDISATDIRARIRAGHSIRYLVPEAIAAHIDQRGLYADRVGGG
jgi:nicotinate-nucleotide adenylyltransferase